MTRKTIMESNALKKRFVRDCNLPINVFAEPYFMQRINDLDCLFGCKAKWEQYCKELEAFDSPDAYLEYYNNVKDRVILALKNVMKAVDMELFYDVHKFSDYKYFEKFPKNTVYHDTCVGKTFISIDIKSGNFSALRSYSKNLVFHTDSWVELISKYTDSKHIQESKYIRQVIFGACNPKAQINYESALIGNLLRVLIEDIPDLDVYGVAADEIILNMPLSNKQDFYTLIQKEVATISAGMDVPFHVEMFDLFKVGDYGWVKLVYPTMGGCIQFFPEFKGINAEVFHMIVKYYFCKKITDDDLVFWHEGRLAKYLEPIENPF